MSQTSIVLMFVIHKLHEILALPTTHGMALDKQGKSIAYWVIEDPSVSAQNCRIIESHLHFDVVFRPKGRKSENLRVWAVRKTAKCATWMVAAQLSESDTKAVMQGFGSATTLKALFDLLWRDQDWYMHPLHVPERKERKASSRTANAFLVAPEKFGYIENL